jgi:hypothetical protein
LIDIEDRIGKIRNARYQLWRQYGMLLDLLYGFPNLTDECKQMRHSLKRHIIFIEHVEAAIKLLDEKVEKKNILRLSKKRKSE